MTLPVIKMIAKYPGRCGLTGKPIRKGEEMYYNTRTRQVYTIEAWDDRMKDQPDPAAAMIQAEQDAYFDTWCQANNI
mgnify:CR=1 FL=1